MKRAIIYWSMTGNTEEMAKAIFEGAKEVEPEVKLFQFSEISVEDALGYDVLALGCPSMGDEILEEGEVEPFVTQMEGSISGKKIALFGSYDWGDGQWMRDWEKRIGSKGGTVIGQEGLIIQTLPDEEGLEECKKFGKEFANA